MSDDHSYRIFWYSIGSTETAPRSKLLWLRDINPRARIPTKVLEDGESLSNQNIRATLRDFIQDILRGVKLHNGMFLLAINQEDAHNLVSIYESVGCDTGLITVDYPVEETNSETWLTLHRYTVKHNKEVAEQICSLYKKYLDKPTGHKASILVEEYENAVKTLEMYKPINPDRIGFGEVKKIEKEIKELQSLLTP